jgi:starvation-inducible outer membrane lipoprotein
MKLQTSLVLVVVSLMLTGCLFTKIVTVPMRLGGAVISIIPAVGNTAHDAIDEAAEIVDEVPI